MLRLLNDLEGSDEAYHGRHGGVSGRCVFSIFLGDECVFVPQRHAAGGQISRSGISDALCAPLVSLCSCGIMSRSGQRKTALIYLKEQMELANSDREQVVLENKYKSLLYAQVTSFGCPSETVGSDANSTADPSRGFGAVTAGSVGWGMVYRPGWPGSVDCKRGPSDAKNAERRTGYFGESLIGGTEALIGLGSSLGERHRLLELAVRMLDADPLTDVVASSSTWVNRPMGHARGWFLNGVVRVNTHHSSRGMLAVCQDIENRLGRIRGPRWADRSIDLDLLLHGSKIRRGRSLLLPHPAMLERDFVMVPTNEIAGDMWHPVRKCTLATLGDHQHAPMHRSGRLPGCLPRTGWHGTAGPRDR